MGLASQCSSSINSMVVDHGSGILIPESGKWPILLPAKHRSTETDNLDAHQSVFHNGIIDTLSLIRQRYWVLRGEGTS